MKILVTAGNTHTPIDQVRCLTNVFSGRTGAKIAHAAANRGHRVTLLTSHPAVLTEMGGSADIEVVPYKTFADLEALMAQRIPSGGYDAILHAAAVGDYHVAGVYAPAAETAFDPQTLAWSGSGRMVDRAAGKVKSDEPELWLRLTRAPKLVDRIRTDWQFTGVLVKFKLEVGVTEARLLGIAEASRVHSDADLMVANTLEGAGDWALVGRFPEGYRKTTRDELADVVLDAVENAIRSRTCT